ncbi:MAG: OmpH family outer membrane protein [Planctomicrobium sp.]|nr:OmpH family outer membrane protein [Planctomicrobium sp.]
MKKTNLWMTAFVATAGLLFAVNTASAQQPAATTAASAHQVGLIDMAHIFKNYEKFKAETQGLQGAAEQAEAKAQAMVTEMKNVQGQMQGLTPGSADYNAKEATLIGLQTKLQTFQQVERRDIVRKQAEVYKKIYVEVQSAVSMYAKHYEYTLIMRFNREELEAAGDPQKIIQGMNRQVVWHRPQDDLTDPILNYLNNEYSKTASAQ